MNISKQPTTGFVTMHREIDIMSEDFQPCLHEIFCALPKINRFNGHTIRPYSVAAHSLDCLRVAKEYYGLEDSYYLMAIFLHDAAEAYIGDIVRPVKKHFNGTLSALEARILTQVFTLFGQFDKHDLEEINSQLFIQLVKEIDSRMAMTEIEQLLPNSGGKVGDFKSYPGFILSQYSGWKEEEQLMHQTFSGLKHLQREENSNERKIYHEHRRHLIGT